MLCISARAVLYSVTTCQQGPPQALGVGLNGFRVVGPGFTGWVGKELEGMGLVGDEPASGTMPV